MSIFKKINSENIDELDNELSDIEECCIKNLPENYGKSWSDSDKRILRSMLKNIINNDLESEIINIAKKLGRSEGGVKGEIKKIVITKFLEGGEQEEIGKELNLSYKNIRNIIKLYLDKDAINDINNLEKENKLLKLRIENIELRNTLKMLYNK